MTPQEQEEQKLAEMRAMVEQSRKDAEYAGFVADVLEEANELQRKEEAQKQKKSLMYRLGKGIRKLF